MHRLIVKLDYVPELPDHVRLQPPVVGLGKRAGFS
jgi:hypothetical protein